jgi:hypothetical protein
VNILNIQIYRVKFYVLTWEYEGNRKLRIYEDVAQSKHVPLQQPNIKSNVTSASNIMLHIIHRDKIMSTGPSILTDERCSMFQLFYFHTADYMKMKFHSGGGKKDVFKNKSVTGIFEIGQINREKNYEIRGLNNLYSVFKSGMLRWTGTVAQEVYIIVILGNLSPTDYMGYENIVSSVWLHD